VITGLVESFDERRGDGFVRSDEGVIFYLHCVNIADGSRSISPGVRVEGRRSVGRRGHDEIVAVYSPD
jgi:cold shock CspA family protein